MDDILALNYQAKRNKQTLDSVPSRNVYQSWYPRFCRMVAVSVREDTTFFAKGSSSGAESPNFSPAMR